MKLLVVALCALVTGPAAFAAGAEDAPKTREEAQALIQKLKFQSGTHPIGKELATVNVPADMRFLSGHDAGIVLTKLWGNPAQDDPLGMLVPANCDLIDQCWAVVITYEEEGYVKDDDAETINYDDLLKQMQKDTVSANKERTKQGYPAVQLMGWAAKPRYDRATHKLYWAKDLKFGDEKDNTLNYNIRLLGRRGVLVLNAVAGMSQLAEIEQATPHVLSAVDFNPGSRYADFDPKSGDKFATYGLAALIAGGVAAKVGLFKGIWLAILAAKKFIIIAIIAALAGVKKLFSWRKPGPISETSQAPES